MSGAVSKDTERDYSQFTDRVYRPYALAIGQFCLAWNDLHERLGILFIIICSSRRGRSGGRNATLNESNSLAVHAEIWHSAHYDRPKRDMLKALLETSFLGQTNPQLIEAVQWILKETDKLEEIRNNAIHTPFQWGPPYIGDQPRGRKAVRPNLFLGHSRAKKLSKLSFTKKITDELIWGYEATLTLRNYALMIESFLVSGGKEALPGTLQLPNRGQTNLQKPPRPVRQAKRPLPPRSSQA